MQQLRGPPAEHEPGRGAQEGVGWEGEGGALPPPWRGSTVQLEAARTLSFQLSHGFASDIGKVSLLQGVRRAGSCAEEAIQAQTPRPFRVPLNVPE